MKTNFWKMAPALLIGLAMSVASCEKPAPEEVVIPVFPEQVYETVEPGESCSLTINPNLPWEVSISGDTQFFRMISGGEPLPVVSGQAGEHTLSVEAIVDETDFEQRQCTLTMKMAGIEQVIAVVNRNGRDRIFNIYPVKVGSDGFEYADGGYVFETEPSSEFSLYFDGNIFQTYMKVEANFDWALKETPEWAEAIEISGRYATSGKANEPVTICLRGANPKYPLDGDKGSLVFVVNDNSDNPMEVEGETTLSIEAVKDIFTVMASNSVRFNAAGDYYNDMYGDWQPGMPAKGSAIGIDGVQVFAVEKQYGVYTVVGSSKRYASVSGWVTIAIAADDEDNVLKNWDYTLRVAENEGAARSAEILVVPGTVSVSDPDYDLFSPDGTEIADSFSKYVCSVLNQDGTGGGLEDGGLVSADADKLASKGAMLEKLDLSMYEMEFIDETFNVGLDNYYQLTVTKPNGIYEFKYGKELWGAEPYILNSSFMPVVDESAFGTWVGEMSETTIELNFTDDDAFMMKFLLLQTGNANYDMEGFAVIMVMYDTETVIGGGDSSALSFKYASWGGGAGCGLRKMSEAEDGESEYYWACKENLYNSDEIYELTYGPDCSMPNLSSTIEFTGVYNLVESDDSWLAAEGDASDLFIDMGGSDEARQGALIFTNYGMPAFAIVCKYDPNF
ncbi:MAG: hypothetical protein K2J62_07065 [Bacteroidales bacterium]|nr:hypothetical protein [Bacteroidales bacterium]